MLTVAALSLALAAPTAIEDNVEARVSAEIPQSESVLEAVSAEPAQDLPDATLDMGSFVPARFDSPIAPIPASVRQRRQDNAIVAVAGTFLIAMTTGVFVASRVNTQPNPTRYMTPSWY